MKRNHDADIERLQKAIEALQRKIEQFEQKQAALDSENAVFRALIEYRLAKLEQAQPAPPPHGVLMELATVLKASGEAVAYIAKAVGPVGAALIFSVTTAAIVYMHWHKLHFILQLLWLLFHVFMVIMFGHPAGGMECREWIEGLRRHWRHRSARLLDRLRPASAPLCINPAFSFS